MTEVTIFFALQTKTLSFVTLLACAFAFLSPASAAERISVVGSSTVYPFATIAAEQFAKRIGFKTPIIEATGTGGGVKMFCDGVGSFYPDAVNASRAIKTSEIEQCHQNDVRDIIEVKIGYDGIVLASAKEAGVPDYRLTKLDLFRAFAKFLPVNGKLVKNPHRTWRDVNPALPDKKIKALGPPPTSGTRDAFTELVMEKGCKQTPDAARLGLKGKVCGALREDGAWVNMGENDNLIIRKILADPDNLGLFGFAFYNENKERVKAAHINGVSPTLKNVVSGKYPVSRPLFVYFKGEHIGKTPGLAQFAKEFLSEDAAGEYGYLSERGLAPLPETEKTDIRKKLTERLKTVRKIDKSPAEINTASAAENRLKR